MTLRLKLDENMLQRVQSMLRDLGIDVEAARSERLVGAADPILLTACIAEDQVLVTLDLDFADMRDYPPGIHHGIWVLRPRQQTFNTIAGLVQLGMRPAITKRTAGQL